MSNLVTRPTLQTFWTVELRYSQGSEEFAMFLSTHNYESSVEVSPAVFEHVSFDPVLERALDYSRGVSWGYQSGGMVSKSVGEIVISTYGAPKFRELVGDGVTKFDDHEVTIKQGSYGLPNGDLRDTYAEMSTRVVAYVRSIRIDRDKVVIDLKSSTEEFRQPSTPVRWGTPAADTPAGIRFNSKLNGTSKPVAFGAVHAVPAVSYGNNKKHLYSDAPASLFSGLIAGEEVATRSYLTYNMFETAAVEEGEAHILIHGTSAWNDWNGTSANNNVCSLAKVLWDMSNYYDNEVGDEHSTQTVNFKFGSGELDQLTTDQDYDYGMYSDNDIVTIHDMLNTLAVSSGYILNTNTDNELVATKVIAADDDVVALREDGVEWTFDDGNILRESFNVEKSIEPVQRVSISYKENYNPQPRRVLTDGVAADEFFQVDSLKAGRRWSAYENRDVKSGWGTRKKWALKSYHFSQIGAQSRAQEIAKLFSAKTHVYTLETPTPLLNLQIGDVVNLSTSQLSAEIKARVIAIEESSNGPHTITLFDGANEALPAPYSLSIYGDTEYDTGNGLDFAGTGALTTTSQPNPSDNFGFSCWFRYTGPEYGEALQSLWWIGNGTDTFGDGSSYGYFNRDLLRFVGRHTDESVAYDLRIQLGDVQRDLFDGSWHLIDFTVIQPVAAGDSYTVHLDGEDMSNYIEEAAWNPSSSKNLGSDGNLWFGYTGVLTDVYAELEMAEIIVDRRTASVPLDVNVGLNGVPTQSSGGAGSASNFMDIYIPAPGDSIVNSGTMTAAFAKIGTTQVGINPSDTGIG